MPQEDEIGQSPVDGWGTGGDSPVDGWGTVGDSPVDGWGTGGDGDSVGVGERTGGICAPDEQVQGSCGGEWNGIQYNRVGFCRIE